MQSRDCCPPSATRWESIDLSLRVGEPKRESASVILPDFEALYNNVVESWRKSARAY